MEHITNKTNAKNKLIFFLEILNLYFGKKYNAWIQAIIIVCDLKKELIIDVHNEIIFNLYSGKNWFITKNATGIIEKEVESIFKEYKAK